MFCTNCVVNIKAFLKYTLGTIFPAESTLQLLLFQKLVSLSAFPHQGSAKETFCELSFVDNFCILNIQAKFRGTNVLFSCSQVRISSESVRNFRMTANPVMG